MVLLEFNISSIKEVSSGLEESVIFRRRIYPIFSRINVEFYMIWPVPIIVDVLAYFELWDDGTCEC